MKPMEGKTEDLSKPRKRELGMMTRASALALVLGVAALIGGLALAYVGLSVQGNAAPTYTPTTVHLQIAVVPDLQGEGWDAWVPNQLTVHQGDTVVITIVNADEMAHGFELDAFNVNQPVAPATSNDTGAVTPTLTTVTFTATQAGTFVFRCNVSCGPGHDNMVGMLVVLPD